jgi:putative oxidoreductase
MNDILNAWSSKGLSLLRFVAGFMMLFHGSQKLFGFPASTRPGGQLSAFMATGGVLEFAGGILIMIGLFTRWTSFLLSGTMAVAYWMFHGTSAKAWESLGYYALLPMADGGNSGELAALYCFVFLYFFFAGGGDWSVDKWLEKKG